MKLLTDEEIMEKYDNGWIGMGFIEREIIRIRKAMEEYPRETDAYGYLYVAQQALYYALDPTPGAQCEHPVITALKYGGKWSESMLPRTHRKKEDSQDC